MELALIIAIVLVVAILWFICVKLLSILEKLAKLLKADNLQEYINQDLPEENNINIWENSRYQDIGAISEDDLRDIKINPNEIYNNVVGSNAKTETFNW